MTDTGREDEPNAPGGVTADVAEHALGPTPDESTITAADGQGTAPAATATADVAGLEPTESPPPIEPTTAATTVASTAAWVDDDSPDAAEPSAASADDPAVVDEAATQAWALEGAAPATATGGTTVTTSTVGVFDGAQHETHVPDEARHDPTESLDEELPTVDPTGSTGLAESQTVAGRARVECPNCETVWEGNDLRPHAAWFSAECQFPLFWVHAGVRTTEATTDDAQSRLPGTVGRSTLSSIDCPNCGEHNPPDPTANCWRCHAPLTPRDPPPPQAPPQVFIAPPVVIPPKRRIWPWVLATGVLALLALVLLIVLLWGD